MSKGDQVENFGCSCCWPASVDEAWLAQTSSTLKKYLIDESHYTVGIWICSTCAQHFLNVTTETIDWQAGEDPAYVTYMPITQAEVTALEESSPPTKSILNAVGPGRRCIQYDYPGGQPPSVRWGTGILVGPHD